MRMRVSAVAGGEEPIQEYVPPVGARWRGRLLSYSVAVVVLAVTVLAVYYSEEIGSFFALQPWDRQGPLTAADAWREGLERSDESLLRSVANPQFTLHSEDGVIVAVQADRQLGPMAAEHITPTVAASSGKVEYDYRGPQRHVVITLPSKSGGAVALVLQRRDGQWMVREFRALSVDWLQK